MKAHSTWHLRALVFAAFNRAGLCRGRLSINQILSFPAISLNEKTDYSQSVSLLAGRHPSDHIQEAVKRPKFRKIKQFSGHVHLAYSGFPSSYRYRTVEMK
jgi:hypothetical protein